jgi:hypothetical protein
VSGHPPTTADFTRPEETRQWPENTSKQGRVDNGSEINGVWDTLVTTNITIK